MELSASIKASLPGRYASALFELASEAGNVTAVEADLETLGRALDESDELRGLIRNPRVSRKVLGSVFTELGGKLKLCTLTQNFLGVLAANRRVAQLPSVIRSFQAIAAAQRGEVTAEVATAHPLTAEQLGALEQKLRAREGRTVRVHTSVDPELLGGLVVTIGSRRLDNSTTTSPDASMHSMYRSISNSLMAFATPSCCACSISPTARRPATPASPPPPAAPPRSARWVARARPIRCRSSSRATASCVVTDRSVTTSRDPTPSGRYWP